MCQDLYQYFRQTSSFGRPNGTENPQLIDSSSTLLVTLKLVVGTPANGFEIYRLIELPLHWVTERASRFITGGAPNPERQHPDPGAGNVEWPV